LLMSFDAGARCGAPLLLLESIVTVRGQADRVTPFCWSFSRCCNAEAREVVTGKVGHIESIA